ncbi:MAG: sigma-70 family RNA polymerase sigma factor [Polyangiaceae bacterium]
MPAPSDGAAPSRRSSGVVAFVGDAALVAGVRARNPVAMAELFDRFGPSVLRLLTLVLGPDRDLKDAHQDVFVRAFSSIGELRDPAALRGWMNAIAINTARATIERRMRLRRWLSFFASDELPEPEPYDPRAAHDAREVLRATYRVLDKLPFEERSVFALRHVDGMEHLKIAEACEVSVATVKRRLSQAEKRFTALARRTPELSDLVRELSSQTEDV